jgi:hypothetical protein
MNGKLESHLEMKWRFIVPAGRPNSQRPRLVMEWISSVSPHSQLSI